MELHVWSGDWGLPSVDHRCLSAMVYCRFLNIPAIIKKTNSPLRSPSGDLPVLNYSDMRETKLTKIFEEFRKQGYDANQSLTAVQSADIVAFSVLMEEKLLPGLLHSWWVESNTYADFTRPFFAKAVGFPLSLFWPNKRREKIMAQLRAPYAGYSVMSDADLEQQIFRDAKECLNLLSTKLGNSSFFFDDRPTSLDAVMFGYLAPLLKMPLSNPLQVHLKACRNLVNFCQNIMTQFFPPTLEELEEQRKLEEKTRRRVDDETEYPHRKRNIFLAGIAAVAAFAAYAFLAGLVQIEFVKEDQRSNAVRDEAEVIRVSGDDDDSSD